MVKLFKSRLQKFSWITFILISIFSYGNAVQNNNEFMRLCATIKVTCEQINNPLESVLFWLIIFSVISLLLNHSKEAPNSESH